MNWLDRFPVTNLADLPTGLRNQQLYESVRLIGQGFSGSAYVIKRINENNFYAVKRIGLNNDYHEKEEEAKLMILLRHENIVNCERCWTHDSGSYLPGYDDFFIQMEFCRNGSLKDAIIEGKMQNNPVVVWRMFSEILTGLKFIHSKGYFHGDLWLENIFLDRYYTVKIGDFGCTKVITSPDNVHEDIINVGKVLAQMIFAPSNMEEHPLLGEIPDESDILDVTNCYDFPDNFDEVSQCSARRIISKMLENPRVKPISVDDIIKDVATKTVLESTTFYNDLKIRLLKVLNLYSFYDESYGELENQEDNGEEDDFEDFEIIPDDGAAEQVAINHPLKIRTARRNFLKSCVERFDQQAILTNKCMFEPINVDGPIIESQWKGNMLNCISIGRDITSTSECIFVSLELVKQALPGFNVSLEIGHIGLVRRAIANKGGDAARTRRQRRKLFSKLRKLSAGAISREVFPTGFLDSLPNGKSFLKFFKNFPQSQSERDKVEFKKAFEQLQTVSRKIPWKKMPFNCDTNPLYNAQFVGESNNAKGIVFQVVAECACKKPNETSQKIVVASGAEYDFSDFAKKFGIYREIEPPKSVIACSVSLEKIMEQLKVVNKTRSTLVVSFEPDSKSMNSVKNKYVRKLQDGGIEAASMFRNVNSFEEADAECEERGFAQIMAVDGTSIMRIRCQLTKEEVTWEKDDYFNGILTSAKPTQKTGNVAESVENHIINVLNSENVRTSLVSMFKTEMEEILDARTEQMIARISQLMRPIKEEPVVD